MEILISDLGGVLLFPKDSNHKGKLNPIYAEESEKNGFNFFDHFRLNTELLEYYQGLKEKGVVLYMITEGVIQNAPEIKPQLEAVFTEIISSGELGLSKKEPTLYLSLVERLECDPSKVIYVDDNRENINGAEEAGLISIQYRDNQELISKLQDDSGQPEHLH